MFPMNTASRRGGSVMGTGMNRSAPVPTFSPANSDVSMESNRRDQQQTQYSPNAGYKPPAIAPSFMGGGMNMPMGGTGVPGGMKFNQGFPPNFAGMQGNGGEMRAQMPMQGGNTPMQAQMPMGGLGPSPNMNMGYGDYKQHMESNLPMQKDQIQTNANRISQGIRAPGRNLEFMGMNVNMPQQRAEINRDVRY